MLTWRLTWNLLLSSLWLAVISTMLGRGGQYGWPSHLATCCPSWDAELPGCFSSNACSCPQTWGRIANYKATKELEASRGWQKIDRQNILLHLCLLSWVRVPLCSSLSLLACCSFGSEGFELLHSICLSKYSCTSCIFSKVNSGLPTFSYELRGYPKGCQKLVSDTLWTGYIMFSTMSDPYEFSQKVLCSKHIHFFLNGHGTPFLCTKKASKRQLTDSFLCYRVPENIPSYSSAGTWSPAGR